MLTIALILVLLCIAKASLTVEHDPKDGWRIDTRFGGDE